MASDPKLSLEAARKALQQGNYPTAIAHLKALCQTELDTTVQVKAQIEQLTNTHNSESDQAIAFCQILTGSSNPQVQAWAVRQQAELSHLLSSASENDSTGFVAFDIRSKEDLGQGSEEHKGTRGQGGLGDKEDLGTRRLGREKTLATHHSPPATRNSQLHSFNPKSKTSSPFIWTQAGRAQRWGNLPPVNLLPFWLLQCGSAIALFWLLLNLLKFVMAFTNDLLVKLPYLEPFQPFYRDPSQWLMLTLVLLLCLLPWLLNALLRLFYGLQPLSIETLSSHSGEASRLLQRYCRQRGWRLPRLGILPTSAPLVLTYGNLPRTSRIVVSQGLLDQLADDEIATIYAAQLGHIACWDFAAMSLFMLIIQLPYIFYWKVSIWADKLANNILRAIAAALTSLAYGLWFLLSLPALWLSQLRIYYSDRFATELTGNPNGLVRALLKMTQGVAEDIQQQGHTSWLLESWNLLTTVSYHQAIAYSSLHSIANFEAALAWDCVNPARYWLCINNSHPLLGDRLLRLNRIAHYWRLNSELNLPSCQSEQQGRHGRVGNKGTKGQGNKGKFQSKIQNPKSQIPTLVTRHSLLLQTCPYLGIAFGFALAGLMWLVGGIGYSLAIAQLAWMWGDWGLMWGCIPIGLSIGIFIRINTLFPDVKPLVLTNPNLPELLANPATLPVNSQPLRLQGKLLGRCGISNWLGQD